MRMLEKMRAYAGAIVLDRVRPGWAQDINLKKLDLADCEVCVLGQLYGSFMEGAHQLFGGQAQRVSAECGFDINYRTTRSGRSVREVTYSKLTEAWKREIKKRQKLTQVVL